MLEVLESYVDNDMYMTTTGHALINAQNHEFEHPTQA